MPRAGRWLYRALSTAAVATGAAALPAVALLRRRWLRGLGERLGRSPRLEGPSIWVHAASVGEVRLALPLLEALRLGGASPCLSTTSVAGRDLARRAVPETPSFLAPLDHPVFVRSAFQRLRPRALAILETELWPELIEAALRRSIPALLLNGRVSDRSMPRYLRLRPLLAPIMAGLACVVPRSETDRDRLVALGCRPEACEEPGDLKGASMPRPWLFPWPQRQRLVLVAGSLHRGEYGLWLDVLQRLRPWPVCHVVAPRHLDRLEDLEGRMREAGVAYDRWSRHRPRFPDPPPQVLLVDTHGDLAGLYAEGDLAFVGGTMDPRRGGHNLYEPAAAGRPVLFGPGVSDHRAAADALLAFGGGVMVNNPAQLVDRLEAWMTHPEAIRAAGQRAYETAVRAYESGKRTLSRAVSLILDAHLGRPG